jgi:diaminopimelate epimerase
MRFMKYHALGNDYLVIEEGATGDLSPAATRRICDRHRGVGSDGILVAGPPEPGGRFPLRILNPDGSEAEKSGNGLRICARYLWDRGAVGERPFEVLTRGGPVTCLVLGRGEAVAVEMGRVRFTSADIPVAGPPREVLRETLAVNGQAVEYSAATIGNPHCILLRDRVSEAEARALGPLLEADPRFPRRTNVQFVEVLDRKNIRIEIWERGAGYTLASGSSSCAAAAVARRLGLCDAAVTVHMPGGRLAIEIEEDFRVRMTGPVAKVFEGVLAHDALADATGPR